MTIYDPAQYWDMKAKRSQGDAHVAACSFDPVTNACIQKAQKKTLDLAVREISKRTNLSDANILDFGCGSGRWSAHLAALGNGYLGVDISNEMIGMCRSHHPALPFDVMDDLRIPAASEEFDVAFSVAVLHHNRRPQQEELLQELSRVLKPGGFLFLFEALGQEHGEREFPHAMGEWTGMVRRHGFKCVRKSRVQYLPLTSIADRIANFIRRPFSARWRFSRIDAFLSPHLSRVVVSRNEGRAAMLFQKIS